MRSILVSSLLIVLLGTGLSGAIPGKEDRRSSSPEATPPDSMSTYTESIPGTLVEFEMVPVPAGSVTIDGTEQSVGPFWMAATEVRWDAYDTYRLDEQMKDLDEAEADAISLPSKPYGFGNEIPGFGQEKYPVLSVARNAARQYARWLSAKTEHTYRLPTAAEWKHACKLSYDSPSEWGPDQLSKYAWFQGNAEETAHPAASLAPSDLGLYDQLGNAAELVAPPDDDPDQKTEVWGGSYQSEAGSVHCSARRQKTPAWQESDPQLPKSKWWLSDAQFVGVRLIRVDGADDQ
jgi:formylglycine-generating enzyme required for sulfatase activity